MGNEWWLIIGTPDGPHCWPVGDDPAELEHLVAAGRVLAGFPASEAWVDDGTAWDVQLTAGEPHDTLLVSAGDRVGTLEDLRKVDSGLVVAHQAARAEWLRARNVETVKLMLVALDADTLAAVLADPAVATRVRRAR
jgi:hypothetical protein